MNVNLPHACATKADQWTLGSPADPSARQWNQQLTLPLAHCDCVIAYVELAAGVRRRLSVIPPISASFVLFSIDPDDKNATRCLSYRLTEVMMVRNANWSPRFQARMAGAIALITTTAGLAAIVTGSIVVYDDAAATARHILAHEGLFRLAVAGDVVAILYIAYTLLLYNLFRPVNRNLSLLAALFSLVGTGIGTLNILFELAPLVVLRDAHALSAFNS